MYHSKSKIFQMIQYVKRAKSISPFMLPEGVSLFSFELVIWSNTMIQRISVAVYITFITEEFPKQINVPVHKVKYVVAKPSNIKF